MKIVIDTNIVLDILACREPFFEQSQAVMQLVAQSKVTGAITASSITDIYYIMRKRLDKDEIRDALYGLMELVDIVDVTRRECLAALDMPMSDYEDALLSCCAKNWDAECIVTRNTKDFSFSPVKALTPEHFLQLFQVG